LIQKYPGIDNSTAEKNDKMCSVMFCEFEDPNQEDADLGMEAVSLVCGH